MGIENKIKELRKFRLYKLRFIANFKKLPAGIHEIGGKKVVIFSKKHGLFNIYTDVWILPLQNPIPVAVIIGGLSVLGALGLSIALLKEIKELTPILYGGLGLTAMILIRKRK